MLVLANSTNIINTLLSVVASQNGSLWFMAMLKKACLQKHKPNYLGKVIFTEVLFVTCSKPFPYYSISSTSYQHRSPCFRECLRSLRDMEADKAKSLTGTREQSAVDKMTVFKSIFAYVHDGTLVYKHHTSCLIMNDVIIIQCYAHVKFGMSNVIFVQERHCTLCILSSRLSCIVKGLLHPKMKMLSLITCHCRSKPVKVSFVFGTQIKIF